VNLLVSRFSLKIIGSPTVLVLCAPDHYRTRSYVHRTTNSDCLVLRFWIKITEPLLVHGSVVH
jgi:hypothetical protein